MEYQSLYRRYRPQKFAEVKGQHHVIRALQNAVRDNRVGHAYLLSGPPSTPPPCQNLLGLLCPPGSR
jgi:DNA polymerase III subunit gamma/tau